MKFKSDYWYNREWFLLFLLFGFLFLIIVFGYNDNKFELILPMVMLAMGLVICLELAKINYSIKYNQEVKK